MDVVDGNPHLRGEVETLAETMQKWLGAPQTDERASDTAVGSCLTLARTARIFKNAFNMILERDLVKLYENESLLENFLTSQFYQDKCKKLSSVIDLSSLNDPELSSVKKVIFFLNTIYGVNHEERALKKICTLVNSLPQGSQSCAIPIANRYHPYAQARVRELNSFREGIYYNKCESGYYGARKVSYRYSNECFTPSGFRPDNSSFEIDKITQIPCLILDQNERISLRLYCGGKFLIPELPGPFTNYIYLRILVLRECGIRSLGQLYLAFPQLEQLDLSCNQLTHVNSKCLPKTLEELELAWNVIEAPVICDLNKLTTLNLEGNPLLDCSEIRNLPKLAILNARNCSRSFGDYLVFDPSLRSAVLNKREYNVRFERSVSHTCDLPTGYEIFLLHSLDRWLQQGEEFNIFELRIINHSSLRIVDQWFHKLLKELQPYLSENLAREKLHTDLNREEIAQIGQDAPLVRWIQQALVKQFPLPSYEPDTVKSLLRDRKIKLLESGMGMFQFLLSMPGEMDQEKLRPFKPLFWNLKDRQGMKKKCFSSYRNRLELEEMSTLPVKVVHDDENLRQLKLIFSRHFPDQPLKNLPELKQLETLEISAPRRFSFPDHFDQMPSLKVLKVTSAVFTSLPPSLTHIEFCGDWEEGIAIHSLPQLVSFKLLKLMVNCPSLKIEGVPCLKEVVFKGACFVGELKISAGGGLKVFDVQHIVGDHVRWKVTGANLERIFLFWSKIGPEELAKNVISLSNLRIREIDLDFGLVLPPQDLKQSISCEIYPTDQSGHRVMTKSSCYEVNVASKSQTHADDSRYDDEINGKKVSISYEKRYLQSVPFYQKLRIGTVLAN